MDLAPASRPSAGGSPDDAPGEPLLLTDPFLVGDWRAVPMENRLVQGDEVRAVEPKVMEVLTCMAVRPGETVSKDTFMAEVWAGTIVTDDVLARCISELRKALGDSARDPEYVETIRKRGYRLIAPVAEPEEPGTEARPPEVAPPTDAAPPEAPTHRAEAVASEAAASNAEAAAPPEPLSGRRRFDRRWAGAVVLGVVLTVAAVATALRLARPDVRPLAARPVTSFPGEERDPALSPDGTRVVFAWDGGSDADAPEVRQFDLYIQNVDGGEPRRLTNHPADEIGPAWNPDGTRIAFAQCGMGGCGIYTIDAAGGVPMPVFVPDEGATGADLRVQDLAWSPDGRTLAFSGRQGGTGAYSLHLLALDGSPPTRLTAPAAIYPGDLDPAFSPDGRRLAFVRTALDGRQDVCVVPVTGGEVTRLAREQRGVTGLDWTADGREVVYAANRDGAAGLWRVAASGGTPRWVTLGADGGEVAEPSVARNGSGITFARQMVRTHIVEVTVPGGAVRPILQSTRGEAFPALSPDGRRLAFVSTRSGSYEVWTAEADGTAAVPLTHFGGTRVSAPRWSPDGQWVLFSARPDDDADLYVARPGGEAPRRLTHDPADEVAPAWSRDGSHVTFASDRSGAWQLYRLAVGGGQAVPVTIHGGVAAAEVPGALLVVRPDRRGLWRLPFRPDGLPDETAARRLPLRLAPADWANWTVADGAVYAIERRYDGQATVVRLDLATGARQPVAVVADVPERSGLAVAPDGSRLYLARSERVDSDIILVSDFR